MVCKSPANAESQRGSQVASRMTDTIRVSSLTQRLTLLILNSTPSVLRIVLGTETMIAPGAMGLIAYEAPVGGCLELAYAPGELSLREGEGAATALVSERAPVSERAADKEDGDIHGTLTLENSGASDINLLLEPSCEEKTVAPKATGVMPYQGPAGGAEVEIECRPGEVVVYGWTGSIMGLEGNRWG